MSYKNHTWSFSSVGGVKRVNFESGQDIVALEQLDQKLWTALSCPVYGLEIDSKTLELIDEDKDGHIRVAEILTASKWISGVIKNPDDLLKQDAVFPLSAINEHNDEGKILLASAKTILKNLGKADTTVLTVEETSDVTKIFKGTAFNGDGVITEDSCITNENKNLLKEIMACLGFVTDRGGKEGIDAELLQLFINACNAYSDWYKKAEENKTVILPFNERTEEAYQSYLTIKSKIDDYFLKYDSIGIGPGLGTASETRTAVKELLANYKKPMVIDADGLNGLSMEKKLPSLPPGSVLTPHPKEFERLFGDCKNDFERIKRALENAKLLNCLIVLKGHHTFIAMPGGKGYFNSTGNAGMATAGSGDVLTGMITGILTQDYSSEEAAILAVYLHGLAGDLAASEFSKEAMIAGDIIDNIGKAFNLLET